MIDTRFSNLGGGKGISEEDSEHLDLLIEQIHQDLGEDKILFDEISVDSEKIIESDEYLSRRGIRAVAISGREMEVTLKYEVFRP